MCVCGGGGGGGGEGECGAGTTHHASLAARTVSRGVCVCGWRCTGEGGGGRMCVGVGEEGKMCRSKVLGDMGL